MDQHAGNIHSPKAFYNSIHRFFHRTPIRSACIAVLLFFVFMSMYMSLFGELMFVDEVEIYLNGYLISRGGMLYRDVLSQHMPVSYYMATLISWFDSHNSYVFRLGFYIIMSTILVALYFRHRKYTPPVALVVGPVFFLMVLPYHSLASSMLSDHWQGIGIGILLLELLRYLQTKRITVSTAIWVSLAIQLSFGVAFLAAYAILPVMLAVIALQLRDFIRLSKEQRPEHLRRVIREDLMMAGIVLLPMAILLIYYAINDNLGNFIEGAYLINTQVYSKYIAGFGSDPLAAAMAPFHNFRTMVPAAFSNLFANPTDIVNTVTLLLIIGVFAVPIWLFIKKQFIAGIAWFVTCIMCGVRGFDNFHSMPYYFVAALSFGMVFSWCIGLMLEHRNYLPGILAIVLLSLCASKLPTQFQQSRDVLDGLPGDTSRKEMLDAILEPEDVIHITDITQMSYPYDCQRRVDFGAAVSTPWTYEVYGEAEMESLKATQPKIIFYIPGWSTWGYEHDVYANDMAMYIVTHYTQYERTDMWIRNDCFSEAMKKLGVEGRIRYLSGAKVDQYIDIATEGVCTEYFVPDHDMSVIGFALRTSSEENSGHGTLGVTIRNEETGETVFRTALDTAEFKDFTFNRTKTDAFELEEGVKYAFDVYMEVPETGSISLGLFRDDNPEADAFSAYCNYRDGENWDYGIYLVEKGSASQRSAAQRQRHLKLHGNNASDEKASDTE